LIQEQPARHLWPGTNGRRSPLGLAAGPEMPAWAEGRGFAAIFRATMAAACRHPPGVIQAPRGTFSRQDALSPLLGGPGPAFREDHVDRGRGL